MNEPKKTVETEPIPAGSPEAGNPTGAVPVDPVPPTDEGEESPK